jgi:hypothetical protein
MPPRKGGSEVTTSKKKLGRNDPCWCGSGKLYKHCHRREDLAKEKQARREAKAARAREAADLEGKAAIFQTILDSGEMDAEEAYEVTEQIRAELTPHRSRTGRTQYRELIEQLRRQAPELYHHDVAYYASNLIADAVADEQWEALPGALADFAQKPDIDRLLNTIVDQLMYHNQVQALKEAMEQMWPDVSDSEEITPWGIDDFAAQVVLLILLDYLETVDSPQADDAALREATAPYGGYGIEWMENAIRHLTSPTPPVWQPADFYERVDADTWSTNLQALLLDFGADQRREANVPLSRSYMMLQELGDFLERQLTVPESTSRPSATRRRSRKGRSKPKRRRVIPTAPASPLVPRRAVLDSFLAEHFGFLSAKPYRVGVVVELLPAYLHFAARVGAIHPTHMDTALIALRPLAADVDPILDNYRVDPHLMAAVRTAWSQQALATLQDDPALADVRAEPLEAQPAPAKPARRPGSLQTFTFKVTYLQDPEVWRVIEISEHQTLDDLHREIQYAVDFDADHLYSFFMSNRAWDHVTEYASPQAKGPSAARVRIGELQLRMKQRFLYLFDYGDEHRFEVQLVATDPDAAEDVYPRVVEEHGKAPPQYGVWDEEEDWEEESG